MAKQPKPMATPRLRFPEFAKSKGWDKTALSSVLAEHKLKSDGRSEVHSVSLAKGVVPQIEHLGRSCAAADTSHYNLVRPYDVIYTKSPLALYKLGIVKQHRRSRNAIVSPLYGVFEPANKYIGELVAAYFDSPSRCLRYLDPLAQKGAKNTIQISNDKFLSGEIYLPNDEREQQKIADCLTSLDEVIDAQGRKAEALKAYKRGLLQQLFPRHGESVPPLRFPEFQQASGWKETQLARVLTFQAGFPFPSGGFNTEGVGPRLIRNRDLRSDDKPVHYSDLYNSEYVVRTGDVLVGMDGDFTPCVWGGGTALLNQRVGRVLAKAASDHRFLYFMLTVHLKTIEDITARTTVKHLSHSEVERISEPFPTKPEQQTIADCLMSLEEVIAAQDQKVEALKAHKRGLMQQLFPPPERQ